VATGTGEDRQHVALERRRPMNLRIADANGDLYLLAADGGDDNAFAVADGRDDTGGGDAHDRRRGAAVRGVAGVIDVASRGEQLLAVGLSREGDRSGGDRQRLGGLRRGGG